MLKMNYFIKRISIVLTCFWAVIFSADAKTNYVSDLTGSDTNNGTSWAQAYKTISNGVAAANAAAGDTILVTNGTYTLTTQISITKSNTLQSVNGRDYTFINGNYPTTTNRCINIGASGSGAVIDGFTITNGFVSTNSPNDGNGGGGINCVLATNVVIKNCTISKNQSAHVSGYGANGGGIFVRSLTSSTVSNCIISYNKSLSNLSNEGGGGIGSVSSLLVVNCEIVGNTSATTGGGVCSVVGGGLVFRNCLISGNSCTWWGDGVYIYGSNNTNFIDGCTIVSNYAGHPSNKSGGGISFSYSAAVTTNNYVYNSVIYSNSAANGQPDISNNGNAISNYFYNCCTSWTNGLTVYNSITNDPIFANPNAGNWRLAANSPCINAGLYQDWMTDALDLDGRRRIDRFSGKVDMGCYEYLPGGMMLGGR